jgi:hypothetical protein
VGKVLDGAKAGFSQSCESLENERVDERNPTRLALSLRALPAAGLLTYSAERRLIDRRSEYGVPAAGRGRQIE